MHEVIVSIDPGQEVGVCIWRARGFGDRFSLPEACAVLKPHRNAKTWYRRCESTMQQVQMMLGSCLVTQTYIEFPAFMESGGGRLSARSGSLVKLVYMCGRIHQQMRNFGSNVKTVEVNEWKGQLPKEVVNNRILRVVRENMKCSKKGAKRRLREAGLSFPPSHDFDALGIGLWASGYFPVRKEAR